jgi:GR25 family glycosyltransferase involved in LPS biosynthesis
MVIMKAFVICLSKIASSMKTAIPTLETLKKYGFDAELFEGTYGNDALILMNSEQRKIHPYGIKSQPLEPEEIEKMIALLPKVPYQKYRVEGTRRSEVSPVAYKKMLRPGVVGCFYSHYRLWKKCVELNEPIFIFEDDVIFVRSYHNIDFEEILIVALGKDTYRGKYIEEFNNPPDESYAMPFYRTSMPGAVGYGITPQAAKKLLEEYTNTYLPADNAINQHVVKIEMHSRLIGRAALEEDGKISLTEMSSWNFK